MIVIVLPAYNEERTLPPLLSEIGAVMDETRLSYKVVIVDDGSFDGTLEVIRGASATMPIACIQHPRNRGLAEAMKTGLLAARWEASPRDIVVTMDSDNTHSPGLIPRMASLIREGHDVVIASRYRKGSRVIGLPLYRRFLSLAASLLFRVLFPIKGVKDFTSGFRAYRAKIIQDMFAIYGDHFISRPGFSCMADILLKIRNHPAVVGEVPLILHYDFKEGKSKMNVTRTVRETLNLVVERLLERRRR